LIGPLQSHFNLASIPLHARFNTYIPRPHPGIDCIRRSQTSAMPGMTSEQRRKRKSQGLCAYNLSCQNAPKAEYANCETHRLHRKAQQSIRRVQETVDQRSEGVPHTRISPINANVHPRTTFTPVSPAPSLQAPTPSWDKVVWVSFPDKKPLDQTATLAIQYFPDNHESLGHDAWLAKARVLDLRNTVIDAEDGGCYVHQGLVTMLAVKSLNRIDVDAYTWDWLTRQLRESFLSSSCRGENGEALRTVFFLHWTTDEPTDSTLDSVNSAVRLLKHIHGTAFRAYPNESEAWQERAKLGDIRGLDDVARSSPHEFSYRPKTCFGHGPCALQEDSITVHKRTHSGCATHVHVRKQRDRQQLTCRVEMTASKQPSKQRKGRKSMLAKMNNSSKDHTFDATCSGQTHWFHQEFVPALRDY
jgi:hypothetical protein